MENLNKENFWNEIYVKYPQACKHFCDWVDEYKAEVGWEKIFAPSIKFHDLPVELQSGIISRYELEVHNNQFNTGKQIYQYIMSNYPNQVRKLFIDLQANITSQLVKLN